MTYGHLCWFVSFTLAKWLRWWLDSAAIHWGHEMKDNGLFGEDAAPARQRMVNYINHWSALQVIIMELSDRKGNT